MHSPGPRCGPATSRGAIPGNCPPNAVALAEASAELHALRQDWLGVATELEALDAHGEAGLRSLNSIGWALKLNHLKVAASQAAPPSDESWVGA